MQSSTITVIRVAVSPGALVSPAGPWVEPLRELT
jgi:hypothetical protein